MKQEAIEKILEYQKLYFDSAVTLDVNFRIKMLKRLGRTIKKHEREINSALKADLGKSACESYMCEVGLTLSEISYMLRHIRLFAADRWVATPMAQYISKSFIKKSPYGTVLIMSPWNYPFLLTMEPLVDALAAGNTAVLKPSDYSPHTSKVIAEIVKECFDPGLVTVVTGGRAENEYLLKADFDYIFFTGSQAVGREVMRNAAERLTPVTLELGGKSPCIVDSTANIPLAAKRIVFGKYLNCGQTCVAPDYIYCDEKIKNRLVTEIIHQIKRQYGIKPLENDNYGKIINKKHFERILSLINTDKVIYGGKADKDTLKIEPAVMENVTWADNIMKEEIFGPVLPILTFKHIGEAVEAINSKPHPLALYMFSQNKTAVKAVTSFCRFGGGCINDTIIHLATSSMAFGGVGNSGMGGYHGKAGFDTFTHKKSIVDKKTWLDLPMRYQPYNKINELIIRMVVR